jgi:hypothetical protein
MELNNKFSIQKEYKDNNDNIIIKKCQVVLFQLQMFHPL